MGRGFFFSMDALCSALILSVFLFTLLYAAGNNIYAMKQATRHKEKILVAAAVSEALVKSRNIENPALGAASYSILKRRVEANIIDEGLLEKAGPVGLGGYNVAGLYARDNSGKKYYYKSGESIGKNCISVERLAGFSGGGRKAVMGVDVCDN